MKKRSGWIFLLCAALAVSGAMVVGGYTPSGRAAEPTAQEGEEQTIDNPADETAEPTALATDAQGIFHLLLVGVDAVNEEETQRSDSMIVLSLDRARGRVVVASFMRDIYCEIPGHGASRLNHAYMWGGIELLEQTLALNFELSPENYVLVGLDGFRAAVDTVGGVELELEEAEGERLGLSAGVQRLDGETALEYARMRDIGNADYDRTARQRNVITALFERARTLTPSERAALARVLWPQVESDLTLGQILSLAAEARDWQSYELVSLRIPVDGTITDRVVDGMMVLDIDFEANRRAWREAVYGEGK